MSHRFALPSQDAYCTFRTLYLERKVTHRTESDDIIFYALIIKLLHDSNQQRQREISINPTPTGCSSSGLFLNNKSLKQQTITKSLTLYGCVVLKRWKVSGGSLFYSELHIKRLLTKFVVTLF